MELFVNNKKGLALILLQDIALFLLTNRFSVAVTQNLSGMAVFFQRHFSGTDNLRVVSIILLLLAFILFLFLIVILYIKSLLSFIKNDVAPGVKAGSMSGVASRSDNERENDMNLTKSADSAQQQLAYQQQLNKVEAERKAREKAERELAERSRKEAQAKSQATQMSKPQSSSPFVPSMGGRGKASASEFDWRKGRQGELDEMAAGIRPFKYTPSRKPLDELVGLIVNMLGRDIDEGKIAQVIKSKCGDLAGEDDIIQVIDSIKNFVSLSNNGKFDSLPNAADLPAADEALYNLTKGDPSYCLALMESLMSNNIDKCQQLKNSPKRDIAFLETSNYACTFGTLASLQDVQLATGAFELAVELYHKNVNAWSRAGDMYVQADSDSKAIWAYQNVLNMGDEDIYPHQVANANKHLSQYYYDQGDTKKAANLYNKSNDYYATIGINQDLTGREEEIINIIESKQEEDMPSTISKLLNMGMNRRSGYM